MGDLWSRRASFLTGLFIALFASVLVSVADTLAALQSQGGPLTSERILSIAARVAELDLLLALPVGLWAGAVLYGAAGDRSPRIWLAELGWLFKVRPRALETVRLARVLAVLLSVGLAGALVFAAAMPIFSRIVRASNAAAVVTLATLVAVALTLSLHATLRVMLVRLLRGRELLGRLHGLLSVPVLLLLGLGVAAASLGYLIIHGEALLYGVDLAPVWWLATYAGLLLLGWLVTCLGPVEALLRRLAHPLTFTLSNVGIALTLVLAVQVVAEVGAHAGLLDGTGVASRVYKTISQISSASRQVTESPKVEVPTQPTVRDTGTRAPDVIIVTVDALRADHLGVYGYQRPTSPNIDAFARRGLVFDQAYSAAPCTSSSFAGTLTSRLPSRIPGMSQGDGSFTVPDGTPTFIEHFRQAGYNTVGLVPLVPKYLELVRKGFDEYVNYFGNSTEFTDKVITALQKAREDERPLLLWAHYLDVHYPYQSWPGWTEFGDGPMDRYDQEIAYTDSQLARLFAQLQWLGYMDEAIVVFSADHGEGFMEHGTRLHGDNLYQEQIHVPLIIAANGLQRGGRFKTRVSLLDLGPTLADLAGIDRISYRTEGRSLLARLKGLDISNPTLMVDGCRAGSQFALVGDHKLYFRRNSGAFYLYDLTADSAEQHNLFETAPEVATPLVQRLRKELARASR